MTDRHVIAIDGIDGSGKSYLAERLIAAAEAASVAAALLSVDDYRRPVAWDADGADEAALYYADYYDFASLDDTLAAFLGGADELALPGWDPIAERVTTGRTIDARGLSLLVVEGVFIHRLVRAAAATTIYLATSEDEARRRILARDRAKGRSDADINRRIDRRYFPSQRRYHAEMAPRERAAIVLDHERLGAPSLVRAALDRVPQPLRPVVVAALPQPATAAR
jgi:uridine kinase